MSPIKGFKCAHHALYGGQTCSNAVKVLIEDHGFLAAAPHIRNRFDECRSAFEHLQDHTIPAHKSDFPCDIPCDVSVGDCGGNSKTSSACDCATSCDWPFERRRYSRRTRRIVLYVFLIGCVLFSYFVYGRDISTIYIHDKGQSQLTFMNKIVQRDKPAIRVVAFWRDQKIYTSVISLSAGSGEVKLDWNQPLPSLNVDRLEIHDARLEIGDQAIVFGQVLEAFENPAPAAEGKRFDYRIKRRWHF